MTQRADGRDVMLGAIRQALGRESAQAVETGAISRQEDWGRIERRYRQRDDADGETLLERFEKRLEGLGVRVLHAGSVNDVVGIVEQRLKANAVASVIVPPDLPRTWRPEGEGVTLIEDDRHSAQAINDIAGVITGCRLAIAETGSIVLDTGPGQGRRLLTLMPDYHLCVIHADQIVGLVPEAMSQLVTAERTRAPITFITGPSATADIELSRVAGVHGPRRLEVILVAEA